MVTDYLRTIQECREEIRIEVCQPEPNLPGYPEVDYHPKDAPIVLIDDLRADPLFSIIIQVRPRALPASHNKTRHCLVQSFLN